MEFLKKAQNIIDGIEEKTFYQYLGTALGILLLAILFTLYRYRQNIYYLNQQIYEVNEQREEVKKILDKGLQVQQKQKEVNALLAENENFKIAGYYETVISQLGIGSKVKERRESELTSAADGDYNERSLRIEFIDLSMKLLTEFLQAIEQNKIVYTKEVEIIRSKKAPNAIDVNVTIATLEQKAE